MTREDAHKEYYEFSKSDAWYKFTFADLIDKIYDDFEEELKKAYIEGTTSCYEIMKKDVRFIK